MCNNYNEGILPNLIFGTSVFLFIAICETAIVCPNVSIENGSSRAIACQSDLAISDFYWYRGYSNSTPILILDSAGKGGTDYGSEHFDISSNGSMILKDVLVEHESYYSFVGYYRNGKFGRALFSVNVTISPDPPCPLIHGCNPCIQCDVFDLKKTGTFICEIERARPPLSLVWNITSREGIYFFKPHENHKRNPESDSWNTFVSLDYAVDEVCGVSGELKCVAEDPSNILQSRVSTLHIETDLCKTTFSADDNVASTRSPLSATAAPLAAIILVVIVVLCLICMAFAFAYIRWGRRSLLRGGVKESVLFLASMKDREVNLLVRSLRRSYDKYCTLTPLPWDNKRIPVADLYTECQCDFGGKDISSTDLMRKRGVILGKRVIFIGEHGSGRTTLTKHVLQQWVQDKYSTCLLIYVDLRAVTKEMTLSDFVKGDLPPDVTMDARRIERVLTCGRIRCLVILDGYEDLSKTYKESRTGGAEGGTEEDDRGDESTSLKSQPNSEVTIGDLLQGKLTKKYPNLHVWVTSRGIHYKMSDIFSPSNTTVEMKGLSGEQLFQYIKKCVVYYSKESEEINLPESNDDDNIPISYWDNKVDSIIKFGGSLENVTKRIYHNVVRFILQNDCVRDFQKTPLLLNITVHLMIRHLGDNVITNRSKLMKNIIDCMEERYCQKKGFNEKDFTALEQKVGEFAFKQSNILKHKEWEFWKQGIGEDCLKTCDDIALLKLSQDTASDLRNLERGTSPSFYIEFYHPHIQDYLVARYVVANTDCSRTYLEKLAEYTEERYTVLIYLSTLLQQDSKFQQLCEVLYTYQKYDALIDCLLENGNYNILQIIMESSREKHISINHLESIYHRKAVWTFCKKCRELEIELSSLSFNTGDFLPFITNLSLPELGSVEFNQIGVSKCDFQKICDWLSTQQLKIGIRFKECRLWKEKEQELREIHGESSGAEGCASSYMPLKKSVFYLVIWKQLSTFPAVFPESYCSYRKILIKRTTMR